MNVAEIILVFVISWWLAFLMALPIGVRRDEAAAGGHDRGAPARPMLIRKAVAATVIAGLVTGGLYWLATSGAISLRNLFGGQ